MDLSSFLRPIPDFPKEGILFWDITPLLASPEAFEEVINQFFQRYQGKKIDVVLGLESRGFLFGAPLALRLDLPFVPLRKPGKLPANTYSCSYDLEYGSTSLEIHKDSLKPGQRVLIVDDLIATGGTLAAAIKLVEKCDAFISEVACVIELAELNGRSQLGDVPLFSLITK